MTVFENKSKVDINENDAEKLIYVEQVINEAMRRYPLTPFTFRYVSEDTKIGS